MRTISFRAGLATAILTAGIQAAAAFGSGPVAPDAFGVAPAVTPAAMCGYTCRRGGRYIPGPPEVCEREGLEYCGPSRQAAPPPAVVVPGLGLRIEGRGGGEYRPRGESCRTITVEGDDGTVRRTRRCD